MLAPPHKIARMRPYERLVVSFGTPHYGCVVEPASCGQSLAPKSGNGGSGATRLPLPAALAPALNILETFRLRLCRMLSSNGVRRARGAREILQGLARSAGCLQRHRSKTRQRLVSNMGKGFLTFATATILNAVSNGYSFGFDIVDITGMPGGTVYPALRRLEETGCLTLDVGEGARGARGRPAAPQILRADPGGAGSAGRRDEALSTARTEANHPGARAEVVARLKASLKAAMSGTSRWRTLLSKPHLGLIAAIGVIVPRRLRVDWREEWEAELRYRERLLAIGIVSIGGTSGICCAAARARSGMRSGCSGKGGRTRWCRTFDSASGCC